MEPSIIYSPCLQNNKKNAVRSDIHVEANELKWEDLLVFFHKKKRGAITKSPATKNDLKKTLNAIYSKFNPRLNLAVDKFFYDDLVLNNFNSKIFFKEKGKLVLEETIFKINENGGLDLYAELDITEEDETNINIELNANGNSDELNSFFGNDKFLLKGGQI